MMNWLPDMDLNHDKQIQSLLCYRYTIGQAGAFDRLKGFPAQSSQQTSQPRRGDIFHQSPFSGRHYSFVSDVAPDGAFFIFVSFLQRFRS